MGDPAPVWVSEPRTFVRQCPSTRLPLPSRAAAAACLSTSVPPALFGTRRTARSPSGMTGFPVPRDASHHDRSPRAGFRALRVSAPCRLLAVGGSAHRPRATCGRGGPCHAMRRPPMLQRLQRGTGRHRSVTPSCRELPGHVALGDELTPRALAPRHHAGTSFLLSGLFAATGPNAALAPRHYRIRVTALHPAATASGPVVTGVPRHLRRTPRPANTTRRRPWSRCRG